MAAQSQPGPSQVYVVLGCMVGGASRRLCGDPRGTLSVPGPAGGSAVMISCTRELLPGFWALEAWPGLLPGGPETQDSGCCAPPASDRPHPPQRTSRSSGHRPSSSWCRRAPGCSCRCSWCPSCRCSSGWTPPTAAGCAVRLAGGGSGRAARGGTQPARQGPWPGTAPVRVERRARCPHGGLSVGADLTPPPEVICK